MKPATIAIVALLGFGGGYIANDQLGEHDRKVTVQHKRDPNTKLPLTGGGWQDGGWDR